MEGSHFMIEYKTTIDVDKDKKCKLCYVFTRAGNNYVILKHNDLKHQGNNPTLIILCQTHTQKKVILL